jgi:6-phosphogluconate dehydrogenase (decarboxylating)
MAQTEIHSADIAPRQKREIKLDLNTDLTQVRQNEDIIVDGGAINKDYLDELSFMEEKITIRLERTSEKNAPAFIDVGVNGRTEWLEKGKSITIARKYVDVLARCKSDFIETIAPNAESGEIVNRLMRNTTSKHPFTVIHDPNPRGYDWLTGALA